MLYQIFIKGAPKIESEEPFSFKDHYLIIKKPKKKVRTWFADNNQFTQIALSGYGCTHYTRDQSRSVIVYSNEVQIPVTILDHKPLDVGQVVERALVTDKTILNYLKDSEDRDKNSK